MSFSPDRLYMGRDQDNFLSLDWETILEGGWTTSWKTTWRRGKKNGNTTTLLFSLKRTCNFTPRKKMVSVHHGDGTLQEHSLPEVRICSQVAYQPINHSINKSINQSINQRMIICITNLGNNWFVIQVYKANNGLGIRCADHTSPLIWRDDFSSLSAEVEVRLAVGW